MNGDLVSDPSRLHRFSDTICFFAVLTFLLGSVPSIEAYLVNADHSYQLTLGRQITLGAFPFVDLFSHYGPLAAFTSAAMFAIHNSLVPESVLCALMYSLSIVLLFRIVRVHLPVRPRAAILLAIAAVVISLFLMGRFYKWYFWFFPLLTLALLCETYLDRRTVPATFARLALAGIICGVAALYRIDLGLACLASVIGAALLFAVDRRDAASAVGSVVVAGTAFAVPMLFWFWALTAAGGHIQDYWRATIAGVLDVSSARQLPLPEFDFANLLSPSTALLSGLFGITLAYVCTVGFASLVALRPGVSLNRHTGAMALCALTGLAVVPQTFHRADAAHLVTVIPTAIALGCIGGAYVWRHGCGRSRSRRVGFAAAVLAVVATVIGVQSDVPSDTETFGASVVARYRGLTQGVDAGVASTRPAERRRDQRARQEARLIQIVHERTSPDDRVLAYGVVRSAHMIERRFAGLFPRYVNGIFDSAEWIARERERFRARPPALIVVPVETDILNPGAAMHDEFIAGRYAPLTGVDDPALPYTILVPEMTGSVDVTLRR